MKWRLPDPSDPWKNHPLRRQPLDANVRDLSNSMVFVLRQLARPEVTDEDGSVPGSEAERAGVKTTTVEALAARGLVRVDRARIPKRAPFHLRYCALGITERGRAALASWELLQEAPDFDGHAPPGSFPGHPFLGTIAFAAVRRTTRIFRNTVNDAMREAYATTAFRPRGQR